MDHASTAKIPPLGVIGWLGAVFALAILFGVSFSAERQQPWVDAAWMLSLVLYVGGLRWRSGPFWPGMFTRHDTLILAAIALVFGASWLPFWDDWRWAYTADSFPYLNAGYLWATRAETPNLLSAAGGIDDWLTWTQSAFFNWPMLVFEPTFFWHRVGKFLISLQALMAIFVFFRVAVDRWWATILVLLVASNYNWLWMSHVSYEHVDSQVFAYLALAAAAALWADPRRDSAWALLGAVAGLSLLFSRIAWGEIAALGVLALWLASRRAAWRGLLVCGGAFLLAALPTLLQIPSLYAGFARAAGIEQERVGAGFLAHIAGSLLRWPYDQPRYSAGLHGPLLCFPMGMAYVIGALIAALALVPAVARRLRIPRLAPRLGLLLLWDIALLALANGRYPEPSQNRVYHLFPLQLFLACVPLLVAEQWAGSRPTARRVVRGVTVAALAVYLAANVHILVNPHRRSLGQNLQDGLVEITQRVGSPIVLFTPRFEVVEVIQSRQLWKMGSYARMEMGVNTAYELQDKVAISNDYSVAGLREACAYSAIVCYELFDNEAQGFVALLDSVPHETYPVLNSDEMDCIRCLPEA